MTYTIIGKDYPNGSEKRKQSRDAHLNGAKALKEEGKLLYAVALLEDGQMVGSVMVMNFTDEADLESWRSSEPYITGGVWETVEIIPCAVPPLFL